MYHCFRVLLAPILCHVFLHTSLAQVFPLPVGAQRDDSGQGDQDAKGVNMRMPWDTPHSANANTPGDDNIDEERPAIDVSNCGVNDTFSCGGQCGVFRETPCSCHAQCLIYHTCCKDLVEQCPNIEQELSAAERRYLEADIKCPERLRWPVVVSCLDNTDPLASKECHKSVPVSRTDIIPVTDKATGIHFKNVHCARCNGVLAASLLPWSGDFRCAIDLKTVDNIFEETINGTRAGIFCPIVWQSPGREQSHGRCIPHSRLTSPLNTCPQQTWQSCQSAPASYLSARTHNVVSLYRNRYCLLCDADHRSFTSCQPVGNEDLDWELYYYSMHVSWNDSDRSWIFHGQASDYDKDMYAMSLDTVTCNATEDLAPDQCQLVKCHPSYEMGKDRCWALRPFPYTIYFTIQTQHSDMHGDPINATDLLQNLTQLFYNMTYDEDKVLVSIAHRNVTPGDQYWTFRFKLFTNLLTFLNGMQLEDEYRAALLSVFQDRNINFTRFCSKKRLHHMDYDFVCTKFTAFAFVKEDGSEPARHPNSKKKRAFMGDIGHEEKWSWRNYLSITFISLSILSLSARVCLQPVITFFHSYACKQQFFLCLSLLMGYITFMLGGFPPPGSLPCVMAAVATHWAMLSALLWMNVNAIQIWRIFRPRNWCLVSRHDVVHYGWHLYAWIAPLTLVGPQVALDQLLPASLYAPLYGQGQCWFNRSRALLLFFIVPSLLISVLNLLFIILITHAVHTQKMQYGNAVTSVLLEVKACSKLVVLVGVTWLLGIPVAVSDEPILGDIFTLANANLGFFITVAIMGNRFFIKNVKDQMSRERSTSGPSRPS